MASFYYSSPQDPNQPIQTVLDFLRNLGLQSYFQVFEENEIGFEDLRLLTREDLVDLKIPIGPRNRILNAIKSPQIFSESSDRINQLHQMALKISQQQIQMMRAIEQNQISITKLAEQETREFDRSYSRTGLSPSRLSKPTMSSMAKQRVIHNKYMRVSPMRASMYNRSYK